MKIKRNKLFIIALALIAIFSLSLTAYAHDVPDMDRLGSVTITARKGETIVAGGTLSIYRVGEMVEKDGNYTFQPVGAFAGCGESFENLDVVADIAVRLKDFADKKSIAELSAKEIGATGSVNFNGLPVGLYLIVQNKAPQGYTKLAPFLVSLPYMDNGKYVYDLSANPKADLEQEVKTEQTNPSSSKPSQLGTSLPQTGQLWWPVPLLLYAGLFLFSVGMALNWRNEKDER